jgi:hypothetical protein
MNWIIPVSEGERANGQLSPNSAQAARDALRQHGCTILRGVFDPAAIDVLRSEFDRQWGGPGAAEMAERAKRPPPNPVLQVGEHRHEILVKMKGAFGDPRIFANPLLVRFLLGVLDDTIKLSGMTVVVSYPGAALQHIHRDFYPLFAEPSVSASLPHYAINVAVPLIDVDATIGPTAICLGSHRWDPARAARIEEMSAVDFQRGDCILIDYRTLHAGLPNKSSITRPILYMVYARSWFFDEANHRVRPSIDMNVEDFEALPAGLKSLLQRAYSQRMRARYLTSSD